MAEGKVAYEQRGFVDPGSTISQHFFFCYDFNFLFLISFVSLNLATDVAQDDLKFL